MKRHLLTFRAGTHFGQKLPDSYPEVMRKLTKYNEKLREDKEFWFSQISNMDETPLFLNIASTKTIARIGSKEVVIKIHGQQKVHVTAILCIIADAINYLQCWSLKDILKEESKRKLKTSSNTKSENICFLSKKSLE